MSATGTFQLTAIHDDLTTAVFCDDVIHVYGIEGGLQSRAREAWLNQDLVEQGQRWLSNTSKIAQCFAVVQPASDTGPQQLRLFELTESLLQCTTPADGRTRRVNMVIDSDLSHSTYVLAARAEGLLVVEVSESMSPNEITLYACSWEGLDRGDKLTESHVPIPARYAAPHGALGYYLDQHAAVLTGADGETLFVSMQSNKRLVIAEISLGDLLGETTWTELPEALTILDLHAAPNGRAYAVCQHDDGLHLWINDGPGRWFDLGDPTQGAIARVQSCRTVFIPTEADKAVYDRVLLLRTDPKSDMITYWRGRLGSEPLALDRSMAAGSATVPANPAYSFGTDDFTVELWAQPVHTGTSLPSAPLLAMQRTQAQDGDGGRLQGWGFFWQDDGTLSFGIRGGGEQHVVSEPMALDGDWHHFAAVRRSGVLELYIDGVPSGKSADTQKLDIQVEDSGGLYFGYDPRVGGGNSLSVPPWFTGRLDEVRLWRRARKAFEIDQSRFQHLAANTSGLCGQWGFDGGIMRDSSSVANHGVLDTSARFAAAGVEFVPAGQPYVRVQSTLMEDWEPTGDGVTLKQTRSYRTTVALCMADGSPRISPDTTPQDVFLSASAPCAVRVAGQVHQVGPKQEAAFRSDWAARLTMVTPAGTALSHPVLFLRTDFMAAGENIVIAPDREVLHKLAAITTDQVAAISDKLTRDDAAALAQTISTAARPALHYRVAPSTALLRAAPAEQKRFYLSPEPCPCCDTHSCDVLCDYRPDGGTATRLASPAFMDHAHWQFSFKDRRFSPVTQEVARMHLALVGAAPVTGVADLFQQFVAREIEAVTAVVTTVRDAGRDLIHAVIHYIDKSGAVQQLMKVLQTVEDIVDFVVGTIRQIVGTAIDVISKVIDIVSTLFAWDDIRATRDALIQSFVAVSDTFIKHAEDGTYADMLRQRADDVWKLFGGDPLGDRDQSFAAANARSREDPIGDLLRKVMQSPQVRWLLEKLNEIGLGDSADKLVDLKLPDGGQLVVRIARDLEAAFEDDADFVEQKALGYFQQEGGLNAVTADQVRGDFKDLADKLYQTGTGPLLNDSIELSGILVKWLRDDLAMAEIELPILSMLLDPQGTDRIRISPLTILATLVAVPLTVGCKAAFGGKPDLSLLLPQTQPRLVRGERSVAADNDVAFHTLVITTASFEAVFGVLNTWLDVRTLNRRLLANAVWKAITPAEELLGAVALAGVYQLPPLISVCKFARLQESGADYTKELLELTANLSAFSGMLPWAWSIYKIEEIAIKCGLDIGPPRPPERDLVGVTVGAVLAVMSLGFWIALGIRDSLNGEEQEPVQSIVTGVAGLAAPLSKLVLINKIQLSLTSEGWPWPQIIVGVFEPVGVGSGIACYCWRNWDRD